MLTGQSGEVSLVFDPACYCSESIMRAYKGNQLSWTTRKRNMNLAQLANWLKDETLISKARDVYIDSTGIGMGIYDRFQAFGLSDVNIMEV